MDPNLACTNEVTPYGESPEAIRPDTHGHTAESLEASRPESERDTLAHVEDTLAQRHRTHSRTRRADPPRSAPDTPPSRVTLEYWSVFASKAKGSLAIFRDGTQLHPYDLGLG